jgi:K+-transporting ATPase ATPase C chain
MRIFISGLKLFVILSILTGILYPVLITLTAQIFFREQANGNIYLIGQKFDQAKYFLSRPSAVDYNPLPGGGSNLSATSKALKEVVAERKALLLAENKTKSENEIPSDLLFASGSGLDPHISPAAAAFQVERVAKIRKLDKNVILKLVAQATKKRDWFILGEKRVNVLKLNQLLDNAPCSR